MYSFNKVHTLSEILYLPGILIMPFCKEVGFLCFWEHHSLIKENCEVQYMLLNCYFRELFTLQFLVLCLTCDISQNMLILQCVAMHCCLLTVIL